MGGIPLLPQPPSPVPANIGGSPGNVYPAPGAAPYRLPVAGQVASGIDQFLRNYWAGREATKQHFSQRAMDAIDKIQQGLLSPSSADMEKIVKWMKKADWPIRTEPPTPQEQFAQRQQTQQQAMQQLQVQPSQQIDPAMAAMLSSGMQGPGAPQGPPPQVANPGLLQRLQAMAGRAVGATGPTSVQSPAGQYLQQLAQAAQTGGPMTPQQVFQQGKLTNLEQSLKELGINTESMDMRTQQQLTGLLQSSLNPNDPRHSTAMDLLVRTGKLPNIPINELSTLTRMAGGTEEDAARLALWGKVGGPMQMKIVELAKGFMDRTGGDWNRAYQLAQDALYHGTSQVPTGATAQEVEAITRAETQLHENAPTAPQNIIHMLAQAQAGMNPAYKSIEPELMKIYNSYPTGGEYGQIGQQRWGAQYGLNRQDMEIRQNQLNNSILTSIRDAAKDETAPYYKTLDDKSATWQAKQAALQGIASVGAKLQQIPISVPWIKDAQGNPLKYNIRDPQSIYGAANWFMQKWVNVPPFLGPAASVVPGQTNPRAPVTSTAAPAGGGFPRALPGNEMNMLLNYTGTQGFQALQQFMQPIGSEAGAGPEDQ